MSFLKLIEKHRYPTRRARFCCGYLKEYKVLDVAVQGIRRSESTARKKRYTEPQICRIYGRKDQRVRVFLPILDWTDKDVAEFIADRKIQCHPLYYDEQGKFHVERRLGCLGCCMASDNGLSDFKKHPKLAKAWLRGGSTIFACTQTRHVGVNSAMNTSYLFITSSITPTKISRKLSMECSEQLIVNNF